MAKKKSILVDFIKSCITYNKLNTIAKIAISGIENICKRLKRSSNDEERIIKMVCVNREG